MCEDECKVKGSHTKRTLSCGNHVETQNHTFGGTKKDNEKNKSLVMHVIIEDVYFFFYSNDETASTDAIKGRFNMGGKALLPFCTSFLNLNVELPSTRETINFGEKAW